MGQFVQGDFLSFRHSATYFHIFCADVTYLQVSMTFNQSLQLLIQKECKEWPMPSSI